MEPNNDKRAPGSPWTKGGKSPNPSGRPKVAENTRLEIQRKALSYCPQAIDAVYQIMMTAKHENTKLKAAEMIMDRGIGKPVPSEAPGITAEDLLKLLPVITAGSQRYVHPEEIDNNSGD